MPHLAAPERPPCLKAELSAPSPAPPVDWNNLSLLSPPSPGNKPTLERRRSSVSEVENQKYKLPEDEKMPRSRFWQQESGSQEWPLWFYSQRVQWKCSACLGILYLFAGAVLYLSAMDVREIVIPYDHDDVCVDGRKDCMKAFIVDQAIPGPALLYYELPELYVNHRTYVESKDNAMLGSIYSKYKCENAETVEQAKDKRPGDANFHRLIDVNKTKQNESDIRPCGFTAISIFTDTYGLYRVETSDELCLDFTTAENCTLSEGCVWRDNDPDGGSKCWFDERYVIQNGTEALVTIPMDETSVALPADKKIFEKHLLPSEKEDVEFQVLDKAKNLQDSWLRSGIWMQHFMVWMRSPASPWVRNLWARIDDGLPRGLYLLNITENSPIWTKQWLVPEKRVVVTHATVFGGNGKFLAYIHLGFGLYCLCSCFFFICAHRCMTPKRQKKPKHVDKE